jgi:hypothetical protein
MSVAEIFQQAKLLSVQQRKELAKILIDTLDGEDAGGAASQHSTVKTGAEIAAMLEAMEPVEFVDNDIDDPVEWVKRQRQKEADRLNKYWDDEA